MALRIIKLVALDLDGTLLRSDKTLSKRNLAALKAAYEGGMKIVPTTGRFFSMMPECIRDLDFIEYAITINGACVYDVKSGTSVYEAELPVETAEKIMEYLDGYDVIYDCYMNNAGWMTRSLWNKADEYAPDIYYQRLIHDFRTPVDDLRSFIHEAGKGVQKIQFFAKDMALRKELMDSLSERFPELSVSSSVRNNVEINAGAANKGDALAALCRHLNFTTDNVIAFGDGLNDLSMIKTAGIGVAMDNGCNEVRLAANRIALTNDEDGVAVILFDLLGI